MSTGFSSSDAQSDFQRARRRRSLERLASRLRGEPGDVNVILPFEEVIDALGRTGERDLGLHSVPLEEIVGTVDRTREFDRSFRPATGRVRGRWERIAYEQRRGRDLPPVSLYKVGDIHFVRDGHHRVSVARALGRTHIDAYVTEVTTKLGADAHIRPADLPLKNHERVFLERVPLPADERGEVRPSDPWDYARLAEAVEAWGLRHMQSRREFVPRAEIARLWFEEEYRPVVMMLREAGLIGKGDTDADAYMAVSSERYRLMRTHEWTEDVIERLRRERR